MNPSCYFIFFGIFTLLDLCQVLYTHSTEQLLSGSPKPLDWKYYVIYGLLAFNFLVYLLASIILVATKTNFSIKSGVKYTFIALGSLTLLSGIAVGILANIEILKLKDLQLIYAIVNWTSMGLGVLLNLVFVSTLIGETTTKRPRYVMVPYGYH